MANGIEIIKELRALEQHYTFKVVRSPEDQERFLRDYVADLREFDIKAIETGCARWRQSGAKNFPTSGQLLPFIQAASPRSHGEKPQPWRPLSDAEYATLSIREKIRHQTILASEAKLKAGPMWREGKPCPPENLSEGYHTWTARARNHEAEIKRLRELINQPESHVAGALR